MTHRLVDLVVTEISLCRHGLNPAARILLVKGGDVPPDPVAAAAWEALMSPDGEYAASASYQAVITAYGPVEPYVSIQAAEERHIDALTRQLQRLGVTVPANPYVGTIPAPKDLTTAAKNWATGEVANVAMYDKETGLPVAGPMMISTVFSGFGGSSTPAPSSSASRPASSSTLTPNSRALSSLLPASAPATVTTAISAG